LSKQRYGIIAPMKTLDMTGLAPGVAKKISPMINEILAAHSGDIHSLYIVGSAVMPDYNEHRSDINSVVVLHAMNLDFLAFLAPLGKTYGKKRIAVPLVMTPAYIRASVDAFPLEFLDFKLIHTTLYGDDILGSVSIERCHLRLQCERDIKTKLIGLRQGYLASLGKKEDLKAVLVQSIAGLFALCRGILHLVHRKPPQQRVAVIDALKAAIGIEPEPLQQLLEIKAKTLNPSGQELHSLFGRYYAILESLEKIIDDIPV